MIGILGSFAVWLSRMAHCRGFGVQSPSDYRFVRYVVNESWPYYAYDDLERELPDVDCRVRKLCRLYFRIANYSQPRLVVNFRPQSEAYSVYIHRGCNRAIIERELTDNNVDLLRIDADEKGYATFREARLAERSILIVEQIKCNRQARRIWRQVCGDEMVGVTFDLYYAGVAFFDKRRYKQNYIINF